MQNQNFDALDTKILSDLSKNARKPYLEIAREFGVSGAAVHQRIQKLTSAGIITGSECHIDLAALGYETCAYVGLFLLDPTNSVSIVDKLREIPEVIECYFTSGRYDVFIKIIAHNNEHLLQLLQEKITPLGMARTETLMSFREVFKRPVEIN